MGAVEFEIALSRWTAIPWRVPPFYQSVQDRFAYQQLFPQGCVPCVRVCVICVEPSSVTNRFFFSPVCPGALPFLPSGTVCGFLRRISFPSTPFPPHARRPDDNASLAAADSPDERLNSPRAVIVVILLSP